MEYDAFISYARDDGQDRAEKLKTDLETRGYQVYLDLYENEPGIEWWGRIEDAITRSRALLFIITERSVKSSVCKREWQTAADLKLPLLPVKVVNRRGKIIADNDIPDHIGKIHYIDTTQDWAESVTLIGDLLTRYAYLADLQDEIQTEIDRSTATRYIEILSQAKPDAVKAKTMRRQFRIASVHDRPAAETQPFETFDAAWNAHPNGVLLLGDPGAGKTTTLLYQAQHLIGAYLADRNQPVPVYDRSTAWNPDENLPLDDWLVAANDLPPDMKKVMQTGRAILILDGLDELGRSRPLDPKKPEQGTYDPRKRFIVRVQEMIDRGNRALITCRAKDYAEIGEQLAGIGAVILQDLTDAQIEGYLGDVPAVQVAVMNDPDLLEICRSPLLLGLIAFGYRDAPAELQDLGSLKDGALRDAIFGQYIETSYRYEQRRRADWGETTPFSLDKMLEVLGHAAMINASGESRDDGTSKLGSAITENVLVRHDFTHHLEDDQIDAFCALACELHILYRRGDATYSFLHLLLRDHLAYNYSIKHLQDKDYYMDNVYHPSPAKALGRVGDTRAIEPLIQALDHGNSEVQWSVCIALGALGEPALQPLLMALNHDNLSVRYFAATTLGSLGDVRAIAPLIQVSKDENSYVRLAVAFALVSLGEVSAIDLLIQDLSNLPADHAIIQYINDTKAGVSDPFAGLTLQPLLMALTHDNPRVRAQAAEALGRLGDIGAVEPLITVLADVSSVVRMQAILALGRLGDTHAFESLVSALADALYQNRIAAAAALADLGDTRAIDPLIQVLGNTNLDWMSRTGAIYGLEDLKDPRAVEPLIQAMNDTHVEVRGAAAEALGTLGDHRAVPALIKRLADREEGEWDRVCDYAADALRQIGTPEALAAVAEWERNGRGG